VTVTAETDRAISWFFAVRHSIWIRFTIGGFMGSAIRFRVIKFKYNQKTDRLANSIYGKMSYVVFLDGPYVV